MKRKGQKYQNKEEYTLKYQPMLAKLKEDTPKDLLCAHCFEIVEWKLKFGKYKKMTQPKKCRICEHKTIVKSYRNICDNCSRTNKVCSKCGDSKAVNTKLPNRLENNLASKKTDQMNICMSRLKESSRRKLNRLLEEERIFFDGEIFKYTETKEPVEGLKLKRKYIEGQFENEDEVSSYDNSDPEIEF